MVVLTGCSLQKCIPRIEKAGEGDCESWYFDYIHCLDKCVCRPPFAL